MAGLKRLEQNAGLGDVVAKVNEILSLLEGEMEEPFVDITDELPKGQGLYNTRLLAAVDQVVIHHVGVDAVVPPENTAAYHVRKGWPGIGYHFYVRTDGTAYQTNHLKTVSYHCGGACNTRSVGICLEGFFMNHVPPPEQLDATKALVAWLLHRFPSAAVLGHREVRQTACPGATWPAWKPFVS